MPPKPYFFRQGSSFYNIMTEARSDFRGGLNTTEVPDNLNVTELVNSQNARVFLFGALEKRTGSRRINVTGLGAKVNGITQWDAPGGKQTVAIDNGFLYYRGSGFGDFTQVDPGVSNRFPNAVVHFATFRASSGGAPLVLYIACGGRVYSWDGTATLTRIDGTNNVPTANLVFAYHTRLFMDNTSFPQFVAWSGVGTPTNFTPSTNVAGGTAMIDVLRGESIQDMEVVGGSLLIATKESIVRFTGYSSNDIQIAQDTQGVSAELGVVGPQAMLRTEQVAMCMTPKGPYAAMEAGLVPAGPWVENVFDNMDRIHLPDVVIGYHNGRREAWYAYAAVGDGGQNKHVLVYNLRLQRWYGPFVYPFDITCFASYEDANGSRWLLAGSSDGFVRHMDIGALDDVLSGGTGGSTYNMVVEFAPIFFADGPGYQKTLRQTFLQANLPPGHATVVSTAWDAASFANHTITDTGNASLTLNYRVKNGGSTGRRLRVQISDSSATVPYYGGFMIEAYHRERP